MEVDDKQKLTRSFVNNLMPNLDFSLVFLCRAPNLLEVHLPYFRSIGTYNMLFSVKGCVCVGGPQKIQGPNFRGSHKPSKQLKLKMVIHAADD